MDGCSPDRQVVIYVAIDEHMRSNILVFVCFLVSYVISLLTEPQFMTNDDDRA